MKPNAPPHHVVTRFATASVPILAAAACASLTVQQRAGVNKVQVISSEPALNCQNLGVVTGSPQSEGPGGMRAKALALGANTVHLDAQGGAMAFYCPDAAEAASEEPTP